MNEPVRPAGAARRRRNREPITVLEVFLFVAGVAVALIVTRPILIEPYDMNEGDPIQIIPVVIRGLIAVLGGVSLVGVPLLLARWRGRRTPWGPGKIAWFAHGTAAWLLWPPIVYQQLPRTGASDGPNWSAVCWLWGTPLMGLYMTAAILTGGWFGRRGRRMMRRSGREQFGLILACLWACTGLYLLGLLYWVDVFRDR